MSSSRPYRRLRASIWLPAASLASGALWTIGSDCLLGMLLHDDGRSLDWARASTGVALVSLSALLLASAMRTADREFTATGLSTRVPGAAPGLNRPAVILAVAWVLVVGGGYATSGGPFRHGLDVHAAQLDAASAQVELRRLWVWATTLTLIAFSVAGASVFVLWRGRRARREMETLREFFAVANRHLNDVVGLVDADGQLLDVNDRAEAVFGWPAGTLVGRNLADLIVPHDDRSIRERLAQVIVAGQLVQEAHGRRADGSTFPAEMSARHFRSGGRDYVNVVVRDISERNRVEAERDEALARLKLHFDSMPVACVILSTSLDVSEANPAFERMFGHGMNELPDRGARTWLVPSTQRDAALHVLTECRDTRKPATAVWEHTARDGQAISVRWNIVPISDPAGRTTGLLAMGEDITARLEAERRLQHQRDLFDLLAQTNKAINHERTRNGLYQAVVRLAVERGRFNFAWIGEVDAADQIVLVEQFGEDHGYIRSIQVIRSADDPLGQGPTGRAIREGSHVVSNDFMHDAQTAPWHDAAARAGVRASAAFPLRHRGAVVGALMVYAGERGYFADDIVTTLDEMAQNISFALDSYAAAAELDTNRRLLQQVIDANESVIYAFDLEGRAMLVNLKFARLVGRDRELILGRTRHEFMPRETADQHRSNDLAVIDTGRPVAFEETTRIGEDPHYYISTKYPLRDADGRIIGVGGVSTEVTPLRLAHARLEEANQNLEVLVRKRTAEAVAAKDRAEEADKAKTAFLSTISHELRTPLNSILGFTSILLEGLAGPLSDEQRRQLGIVQDSSRHLLAMVNDLLDISRIEAGRLVTESKPFDLGALLQRVVDRFEVLARERNLEFALEGAAGLPQMVSDARRVEQILANLVSNALRYTTAGKVTIRAAHAGNEVTLDVADTGPGIAATDLPRLFKPFSQLSNSAGFKEGSGLGLAISLGLTRTLGGDVTVRSMPGSGSVFSVTLPLSRRAG